jgi:hypothetical protein
MHGELTPQRNPSVGIPGGKPNKYRFTQLREALS